LLAIGANREAKQVLEDLRSSQLDDGHWPQNMWCGGRPYWDNIQLGETTLPILLADRLRREALLSTDEARSFWPMIQRAISYIIRKGPSTQEDRWENERGYTPFTLGCIIGALLAAADAAEIEGEAFISTYLRETADAWNASIEDWLYVEGTNLARRVGVDGYYIRIAPPEWAELASTGTGRLDNSSPPYTHSGIPITEIVSPDVLALVRFGLRAPDDPRILSTIKVVDATLKTETTRGDGWRRYTDDYYGEHEDGSSYFQKGLESRGRLWPLLTGERAHYELVAGRAHEAIRLMHHMEAFASDSGMIPEQVWDEDDIPEHNLYNGRPTGSAMPLAWAHAEYLTLRRSIAAGRIVDLPAPVAARYPDGCSASRVLEWRPQHQRLRIPQGTILRAVLHSPARIRWGAEGVSPGQHETFVETRDTTLGVHIADLETQAIPAGSRLLFSIEASQGVSSYEVHIVRA
jgi:glucoamylase